LKAPKTRLEGFNHSSFETYKADPISNLILRESFLYQTRKKLLLNHAIVLCATRGPCNSAPNKILKILSVQFVAFRCGVYMPNLNIQASKLWEEIEVTTGWSEDRQPL